LDIAAGLALALLALIAILPEYAVDFVFTAKAGQEFAETGQASQYGPLALANMTGGNQLLIGLGWPLVILIGTWRVRKAGAKPEDAEGTTATEIHLSRGQSVDIAYLTIASVYGLTLFLKETLTLFDAVVLVAIYALYLRRLSGAPPSQPHLVGPSAYIGSFPKRTRRIINYAGFVVAAAVILLCAEPFAESIIELGEAIGVSEFLLVKWIAPTASEAPELLVATLFAWRLASRTGLGALISSKVNQWTLLVGTLPIVFSIFAGMLVGLPLGTVQRVELFVTAAQSVFAVAIVASRSVSRREAWVMLGLFIAQLAESGLAELGHISEEMSANARIGVGIVFLLAAAWVLRKDFRAFITNVNDGLRTPWDELAHERVS
jgi:cation:H+ antiporter